MLTPSPEIIAVLTTLAPVFTQPTFARVVVLVCGTLLAPGRRTVAAALRAVGLGDTPGFANYHRVLNRARWVPFALSHCLFRQLVLTFTSPGAPLVLLIDETLDRRASPKIRIKGLFRDPVRSTEERVVCTWGIRWCVVGLLVSLPWCARRWALPFLAVPILAERTCKKLGKRHVGSIAWACRLLTKVHRWCQELCPERTVYWVGDGGYAAVELIHHCQGLTTPRPTLVTCPDQPQSVRLVGRFRLDAVLHDPVGPQPPGKRGRKPKKGVRQPTLATRQEAPDTDWRPVSVAWYGNRSVVLQVATGTALWCTQGQDPVWIRWVLVRKPQPSDEQTAQVRADAAELTRLGLRPGAYFTSDPTLRAEEILSTFVQRWNIEVTFEEARAHLGLGSQRHWSRRAVGRVTPCLLGLFSIVVLVAHRLHPESLPVRQSAWYEKEEATFIDALAAVRACLWRGWGLPLADAANQPQPEATASPVQATANYEDSACTGRWCLIQRQLLAQLCEVAYYST